MRPQLRHRGAARSSILRVHEVGGLLPEGASDFRRKCSEYPGPARAVLHRPASAPVAGKWRLA
jgi:hypothetical protein